MKMLLLLMVAFFAVFLWSRRKAAAQRPAESPRPPAAVGVVACAHCGVHVPQADALAGPNGHYCSVEHRLQAGR